VRTDGSNSNDGLSNTSGGAFLTIQKALDVAYTLDLGGFAVTIQVADGTYAGTILINKPFVGGLVTLQGNTTTPANCIISHSAFNSFSVTGSSTEISVFGFRIVNSAASSLGNGINVAQGASVTLGNIDFGTCTRCHIELGYAANVQMGANYSITGGSINHVNASANALFTIGSRTITLTGTPAFSGPFMSANTGAQLTLFSNTWSGAATGVRYSATLNSVINTFGAGATHLPGNAAGSVATGGQYA
jgi:hypothetical protein